VKEDVKMKPVSPVKKTVPVVTPKPPAKIEKP